MLIPRPSLTSQMQDIYSSCQPDLQGQSTNKMMLKTNLSPNVHCCNVVPLNVFYCDIFTSVTSDEMLRPSLSRKHVTLSSQKMLASHWLSVPSQSSDWSCFVLIKKVLTSHLADEC